MKKNLLVFSLIFSAFHFFGFAAETEASTEKEKSDGQKTTAGLCINKFKDNWALSLGIGADMYFGLVRKTSRTGSGDQCRKMGDSGVRTSRGIGL